MNGWVGEACSPGIVLEGTFRSSTGKIGTPVSLCRTNNMPGLRSLHNRWNGFAVARHRNQRRRRGVVVIPEIVVNGLEVPYNAAGGRPERHDRVRIAVVAGTKRAVVVGGCARRGQEDQSRAGSALMIDQTFAAPVRAALPSRQLTNAGSFGSWGIGCQVQRSAPVRASNARTSPLAGAGRELSAIAAPVTTRSLTTSGGEVHLIGCRERRRNAQSFSESDRAFDAERHAGITGCAVERYQPRIHRRDVNAATAGRTRFQRVVHPCRDTAVREIAEAPFRIHPCVKAPDLSPRRRLQCHHFAERRADVHHVVDDDRRHLQRRLAGQIERRARPCDSATRRRASRRCRV